MQHKKADNKLSWLERIVTSKGFVIFIFLWFFFQAAYMAVSTRLGISPDETYHYSLIQLFEKNGWLPFIHNQSGFYQLGEVRHLPFFLYNYLLSIPFHFFSGYHHSLILLRIINIGFGIASLYFVSKIAARLGASPLVKNLSLFMFANTLMFVFLAGMLNYDNLFILLSLIEIDLMISLWAKFDIYKIIGLMLAALANVLTVINAWPLTLAVICVLIFRYLTHRDLLPAHFRNIKIDNTRLNLLFAVLALILAFLFTQRYILNVIEYHSPAPACQKVNSLSECEQSGIFLRDKAFSKSHPPATEGLFSYIGTWLQWMRYRTFGIFGHQFIDPTKLINVWVVFLVILFFAAITRGYRKTDLLIGALIGIIFFYLVVLYINNYSAYHKDGISGVAVQGRYFLPFIPLIYLIGNIYLERILKHHRGLLSAYIVATLLIFITASLPSYIIKTDKTWYTDRTTNFNQKAHNNLEKLYRL